MHDDIIQLASVDYALTGIPYYNNVPFFELNALWASWFDKFNFES